MRTSKIIAKAARAQVDRPWRVYREDCLLGVHLRVKHGLPTLLATDPPYNIGQMYSDYVDNKPQAEYLSWLKARLRTSIDHLHPHASIWIAINDANVSELDVMCKRELGLFPRRKVIWHYTFGQNGSKNFTASHITWLYYTRHKTKFTFNPDAIRVPSSRQLVYNDKRQSPKGRLPNDTWVLLPEREPAAFKPLDNTWLFSRVCGTFKAKVEESPNQMPIEMMRRIVLACSNPGDTVLDSFNGTGTTGAAAIAAGRKYIGFDVSKACITATEKLLAEQANGAEKGEAQMQLFTDPVTGKESTCKAPTKRNRRS
jgi:DNA modification methylase